jgi:hypothetical protein
LRSGCHSHDTRRRPRLLRRSKKLHRHRARRCALLARCQVRQLLATMGVQHALAWHGPQGPCHARLSPRVAVQASFMYFLPSAAMRHAIDTRRRHTWWRLQAAQLLSVYSKQHEHFAQASIRPAHARLGTSPCVQVAILTIRGVGRAGRLRRSKKLRCHRARCRAVMRHRAQLLQAFCCSSCAVSGMDALPMPCYAPRLTASKP